MTVVFDKEHHMDAWRKRLKFMEVKLMGKLIDPVKETYLDAIENVIKNTPATSGETKAGWAKPLEVEGRSLAAVITPEVNILSKKDAAPKESAIDKGLKLSIYRKELEPTYINLETINAAPGAISTEYGDSRTPPTAAVRQAAMTLEEDLKKTIGTILKEVSK